MNAGPLIFAHRGVSSVCPENTLVAFQKAIEIGADGVELDVHRSRDGKLVVCHDESVNRTTNGKGLIQEMDWADLRKLDAGGWFSEAFRGEPIPLLEEVLDLIKPSPLQINIELKTDFFFYPGIEEQAYHLVKQFWLEDRVLFSSFNHYTVMKLKSLSSSLRLGLLYGCHLYEPYKYAKTLGIDALHPPIHLVTQEIVAACKKEKLRVHAWFSREQYQEEQARMYLQSGVDILITNYPQYYLALR